MLGMLLGSVFSGLFGMGAANKAANAQQAMGQKSLDLQKYIFDQQTAMSQPWRDAGQNALAQLAALNNGTGTWQQDPGYQFRVQQGQDALSKMAAARGIRMSGATLQGSQELGQNMASQEYGNYFNRLLAQAGLGQTANAQQASAGQNYANAGANIYGNMGQAQASGYMNQNDAFQGTMNNLFNLYGMNQAGYFK